MNILCDSSEAMNCRMNLIVIEMYQELEDFFVDVFQINPVPLRFLPTPLKPIYVGASLGYQAGEFGASQPGPIMSADLFTPEIQRYEQTALVGLGGMVI